MVQTLLNLWGLLFRTFVGGLLTVGVEQNLFYRLKIFNRKLILRKLISLEESSYHCKFIHCTSRIFNNFLPSTLLGKVQ